MKFCSISIIIIVSARRNSNSRRNYEPPNNAFLVGSRVVIVRCSRVVSLSFHCSGMFAPEARNRPIVRGSCYFFFDPNPPKIPPSVNRFPCRRWFDVFYWVFETSRDMAWCMKHDEINPKITPAYLVRHSQRYLCVSIWSRAVRWFMYRDAYCGIDKKLPRSRACYWTREAASVNYGPGVIFDSRDFKRLWTALTRWMKKSENICNVHVRISNFRCFRLFHTQLRTVTSTPECTK